MPIIEIYHFFTEGNIKESANLYIKGKVTDMVFKRKEKEDSQSKDALSDLEVHTKYWEFIFTRFIQGITERITKSLEDCRNIASLDIMKVLIDSFVEEGKPWLKKLIEKLSPLSTRKHEP